MEQKEGEKKARVKCPYCGYVMPITYGEEAECEGVFVKCKGRNCKQTFEIKIKGKQYW